MEKIWKDWIVFIGIVPHEYDRAITVINMWNDHLARNGLNEDSLKMLNMWLFESRRYVNVWHSCCLSCNSMRTECHHIIADWIEGGGLTELPKVFVKHKDETNIEQFDEYGIRNLPVRFFEEAGEFYVIGMTLDGHILIDTHEKYGIITEQKEQYDKMGHDQYMEEFLKTVKDNHKALMLPVVPKGILKLPINV